MTDAEKHDAVRFWGGLVTLLVLVNVVVFLWGFRWPPTLVVLLQQFGF